MVYTVAFSVELDDAALALDAAALDDVAALDDAVLDDAALEAAALDDALPPHAVRTNAKESVMANAAIFPIVFMWFPFPVIVPGITRNPLIMIARAIRPFAPVTPVFRLRYQSVIYGSCQSSRPSYGYSLRALRAVYQTAMRSSGARYILSPGLMSYVS
ncbi:MAG: hypothetical protein E7Z99_09480 [Coriobacteriaceae bacterium]|nr:hypothetical protein [Coriobacteriaceae bacterium]